MLAPAGLLPVISAQVGEAAVAFAVPHSLWSLVAIYAMSALAGCEATATGTSVPKSWLITVAFAFWSTMTRKPWLIATHAPAAWARAKAAVNVVAVVAVTMTVSLFEPVSMFRLAPT